MAKDKRKKSDKDRPFSSLSGTDAYEENAMSDIDEELLKETDPFKDLFSDIVITDETIDEIVARQALEPEEELERERGEREFAIQEEDEISVPEEAPEEGIDGGLVIEDKPVKEKKKDVKKRSGAGNAPETDYSGGYSTEYDAGYYNSYDNAYGEMQYGGNSYDNFVLPEASQPLQYGSDYGIDSYDFYEEQDKLRAEYEAKNLQREQLLRDQNDERVRESRDVQNKELQDQAQRNADALGINKGSYDESPDYTAPAAPSGGNETLHQSDFNDESAFLSEKEPFYNDPEYGSGSSPSSGERAGGISRYSVSYNHSAEDSINGYSPGDSNNSIEYPAGSIYENHYGNSASYSSDASGYTQRDWKTSRYERLERQEEDKKLQKAAENKESRRAMINETQNRMSEAMSFSASQSGLRNENTYSAGIAAHKAEGVSIIYSDASDIPSGENSGTAAEDVYNKPHSPSNSSGAIDSAAATTNNIAKGSGSSPLKAAVYATAAGAASAAAGVYSKTAGGYNYSCSSTYDRTLNGSDSRNASSPYQQTKTAQHRRSKSAGNKRGGDLSKSATSSTHERAARRASGSGSRNTSGSSKAASREARRLHNGTTPLAATGANKGSNKRLLIALSQPGQAVIRSQIDTVGETANGFRETKRNINLAYNSVVSVYSIAAAAAGATGLAGYNIKQAAGSAGRKTLGKEFTINGQTYDRGGIYYSPVRRSAVRKTRALQNRNSSLYEQYSHASGIHLTAKSRAKARARGNTQMTAGDIRKLKVRMESLRSKITSGTATAAEVKEFNELKGFLASARGESHTSRFSRNLQRGKKSIRRLLSAGAIMAKSSDNYAVNGLYYAYASSQFVTATMKAGVSAGRITVGAGRKIGGAAAKGTKAAGSAAGKRILGIDRYNSLIESASKTRLKIGDKVKSTVLTPVVTVKKSRLVNGAHKILEGAREKVNSFFSKGIGKSVSAAWNRVSRAVSFVSHGVGSVISVPMKALQSVTSGFHAIQHAALVTAGIFVGAFFLVTFCLTVILSTQYVMATDDGILQSYVSYAVDIADKWWNGELDGSTFTASDGNDYSIAEAYDAAGSARGKWRIVTVNYVDDDGNQIDSADNIKEILSAIAVKTNGEWPSTKTSSGEYADLTDESSDADEESDEMVFTIKEVKTMIQYLYQATHTLSADEVGPYYYTVEVNNALVYRNSGSESAVVKGDSNGEACLSRQFYCNEDISSIDEDASDYRKYLISSNDVGDTPTESSEENARGGCEEDWSGTGIYYADTDTFVVDVDEIVEGEHVTTDSSTVTESDGIYDDAHSIATATDEMVSRYETSQENGGNGDECRWYHSGNDVSDEVDDWGYDPQAQVDEIEDDCDVAAYQHGEDHSTGLLSSTSAYNSSDCDDAAPSDTGITLSGNSHLYRWYESESDSEDDDEEDSVESEESGEWVQYSSSIGASSITLSWNSDEGACVFTYNGATYKITGTSSSDAGTYYKAKDSYTFYPSGTTWQCNHIHYYCTQEEWYCDGHVIEDLTIYYCPGHTEWYCDGNHYDLEVNINIDHIDNEDLYTADVENDYTYSRKAVAVSEYPEDFDKSSETRWDDFYWDEENKEWCSDLASSSWNELYDVEGIEDTSSELDEITIEDYMSYITLPTVYSWVETGSIISEDSVSCSGTIPYDEDGNIAVGSVGKQWVYDNTAGDYVQIKVTWKSSGDYTTYLYYEIVDRQDENPTDITEERIELIETALSYVGVIPYEESGEPEDWTLSDFGWDEDGNVVRGLNSGGFVNFLLNQLGYGFTKTGSILTIWENTYSIDGTETYSYYGDGSLENIEAVDISDYDNEDDFREAVVNWARQWIGNPYVWGGNSLTNGIDCSHFVYQVLTQNGIYSGSYMTSSYWRSVGTAVSSLSEAQPGDIICYDGHVSIFSGYDEDGTPMQVHARGKAYGICESAVSESRIITIRNVITPAVEKAGGFSSDDEDDASSDDESTDDESSSSSSSVKTVSSTSLTGTKLIVYQYFSGKGLNNVAIAGIMGNIMKESSFLSNNLQDSYEDDAGMTDEQYTNAVDDGTYSRFTTDGYGYGLFQFTSKDKKTDCYECTVGQGLSISDAEGQCEAVYQWFVENGSWTSFKKEINSAASVGAAAKIFHNAYESSSDSDLSERISYAETAYVEITGSSSVAGYEDDLLPGDLGFINTYADRSDDDDLTAVYNTVGIYLGENDYGQKLWITCSSTNGTVSVVTSNAFHYYRRLRDW